MNRTSGKNKSILRLHQALIALLQQQPYEEIQVTHLVHEAGIARATFYLHFSSKEEVLVDYIDGMFETFFAQVEQAFLDTESLDEQAAKLMFQTFKDDAEFCTVLLQDALQPVLLKRFRGYLSRIIGHIRLSNQTFNVADTQLAFLVDYWAGGSLQLISKWVSEGFEPEVDVMAGIYAKLTISGMKALLPE